MSLIAIVPVKPFSSAKLRLGPALRPAQRRALAESLFLRTLAIVQAQVRDVVVVSRAPEALALACAWGVTALRESGPPSLNASLMQATRFARSQGATRLLVVPTDLPLLEPRDLEVLSGFACAIAPDRGQAGTNALLWPAAPCSGFHFGPNSFHRHLIRARAEGFEPRIVKRSGLASDLDTPADLVLLRKTAFA